MKLLIDIGNTRCKWGLARDAVILWHRASDEREPYRLAEIIIASLKAEGVDVAGLVQMAVAAVSSAEMRDALVQALGAEIAIPVWCPQVLAECLGVRPAYARLENLGVDRWLALLAARRRSASACWVVDAGSAITADYLDDGGRHEGGLIAPGAGLMTSALFNNTHAVKLPAVRPELAWQLGRDTRPCVEGGLGAMMRGFIAELMAARPVCPIFLTGGDAPLFAAVLAERARCCEALVLEGLLLALDAVMSQTQ